MSRQTSGPRACATCCMSILRHSGAARRAEPGIHNPYRQRKHTEPEAARPVVMDSGLALSARPGMTALTQIQFLEKIIALVVDDNEGGEILHLDAPDRLHAEFRIFQALDFL